MYMLYFADFFCCEMGPKRKAAPANRSPVKSKRSTLHTPGNGKPVSATFKSASLVHPKSPGKVLGKALTKTEAIAISETQESLQDDMHQQPPEGDSLFDAVKEEEDAPRKAAKTKGNKASDKAKEQVPAVTAQHMTNWRIAMKTQSLYSSHVNTKRSGSDRKSAAKSSTETTDSEDSDIPVSSTLPVDNLDEQGPSTPPSQRQSRRHQSQDFHRAPKPGVLRGKERQSRAPCQDDNCWGVFARDDVLAALNSIADSVKILAKQPKKKGCGMCPDDSLSDKEEALRLKCHLIYFFGRTCSPQLRSRLIVSLAEMISFFDNENMIEHETLRLSQQRAQERGFQNTQQPPMQTYYPPQYSSSSQKYPQ